MKILNSEIDLNHENYKGDRYVDIAKKKGMKEVYDLLMKNKLNFYN